MHIPGFSFVNLQVSTSFQCNVAHLRRKADERKCESSGRPLVLLPERRSRPMNGVSGDDKGTTEHSARYSGPVSVSWKCDEEGGGAKK
jgi:hypothetical protein